MVDMWRSWVKAFSVLTAIVTLGFVVLVGSWLIVIPCVAFWALYVGVLYALSRAMDK